MNQFPLTAPNCELMASKNKKGPKICKIPYENLYTGLKEPGQAWFRSCLAQGQPPDSKEQVPYCFQ